MKYLAIVFLFLGIIVIFAGYMLESGFGGALGFLLFCIGIHFFKTYRYWKETDTW